MGGLVLRHKCACFVYFYFYVLSLYIGRQSVSVLATVTAVTGLQLRRHFRLRPNQKNWFRSVSTGDSVQRQRKPGTLQTGVSPRLVSVYSKNVHYCGCLQPPPPHTQSVHCLMMFWLCCRDAVGWFRRCDPIATCLFRSLFAVRRRCFHNSYFHINVHSCYPAGAIHSTCRSNLGKTVSCNREPSVDSVWVAFWKCSSLQDDRTGQSCWS